MYPNEFKYTDDHEWIRVDGDVGTVGITDFAQSELGDITNVELPVVGREVKRKEAVGTIDSTKAVSEIFSPVSGVVTDVNDSVVASPETLNSDPHAGGWLYKIRLADSSELDALMDAAAYRTHVGA